MTAHSPTDSHSQHRENPAPDAVVCFDRDCTVSVNPHPDYEAVPLSWVKYLAHESSTTDVWATGNQSLREEASIPGISEAITCWRHLTLPENPMEFHTHVPVSGRLPGRREGLHLLQSIYERIADSADSPHLVVVDDVDLSELESDGWTHYFPWEFVEQVEADTTVIDIPTPLEEPSNLPLTNPNCPETYPPIDFDHPGPLRDR